MLPKIEKKMEKITYYLSLLYKYKENCKERFLTDPMYEGALLHYLYKVADSSISLGEMVLKYKNKDAAQSYYDTIDTLGEYDIIPRDFAYDFAKIASFRNFLAHDYEKIDYLIICEEVLNKLKDIEQYVKYIKESL